MRKEALAAYNPQHPVEQAVQDAYYGVAGRNLTMGETKAVVRCALGLCGLREQLLSHPQAAASAMFVKDTQTPYLYIPCFEVELRNILRARKIVAPHEIGAFCGTAAKRLLIHYDTLIAVDTSKLPEPVVALSGMNVYPAELDVDGAVVRVMTRQRIDSSNASAAERIVADEYPEAAVYPWTDAPGIAAPKVAQLAVTQPEAKFIVNIPSLGIKNEPHTARTPDQAVQTALNRKFQESGEDHRQPIFTAQYWQGSGFWDMIVRPAQHARTAMTNEEINLDPYEAKLANLLLEINEENSLGLTFRFAGGWVRDKLLGLNSDDIDVALNKMTGSEFRPYLEAKLGKKGNVIKADAAQSKHIETLTINIWGRKVEFNNLRTEVYSDSRIPEVKFGTPKQDAFRRDLTVNAMYYNVNTGEVEDLTGKGRQDLAGMFLRTPLDPKLTFSEDPLRVLRVLRFASRWPGAAIEVETINAMADSEVQDAFAQKISAERIWTELLGMCKGKQPEFGFRLLYDTGLWNRIADVAEVQGFHKFSMDQNSPWHIDTVIDHTIKVVAGYNKMLIEDGCPDDERARLVFASFLHDIGKLDPQIIKLKTAKNGREKNTYKGHDLVSAKVATAILTKLKAAGEDIELISTVCEYHMLPHDDVLDKTIRKMIRRVGRNNLRRIIQHGMADAYSKPCENKGHSERLLAKAATITESAPEEHAVKPVLSGVDLMPKFPTLSPDTGYLKDIQARLQDMKDENPAIDTAELWSAVEAMRPEIEARYANAPKGWYGQMKSAEAKTVCGQVLKQVIGLYDKNPTLILATPQTRYKIRLSGETMDSVSELEKLLGKTICALGIISDGLFVISKYNLLTAEDKPDEVKMLREAPSEISQFKEGDPVRKRNRGLAFKQIEGRVERVDGNLMYVRWEGIDDLEVFRLTDTVSLHALIEKA